MPQSRSSQAQGNSGSQARSKTTGAARGSIDILVPETDAAFLQRIRQAIQIARDGGRVHNFMASGPAANSLNIEFDVVDRLCEIAERGLTTRRRA